MKLHRLSWNSPKDREILLQSLKNNEISIGTSDTVIGLIASLTQEAFEKLNAIKGRQKKPYLIIISSLNDAAKFTDGINDAKIKRLVNTIWPGPATLILPAKDTVPFFMKSSEGTVALRMPDHAGMRDVAQQLGGLFSTSANRAGQSVPHSFDSIDPYIIHNCSYFISNGNDSGKNIMLQPSTIIDCTTDPFKIVRTGAIDYDNLKHLL